MKSYVVGKWEKVKKEYKCALITGSKIKKKTRNALAVKQLLAARYPFTGHKNPRPFCCVYSTKSTISF